MLPGLNAQTSPHLGELVNIAAIEVDSWTANVGHEGSGARVLRGRLAEYRRYVKKPQCRITLPTIQFNNGSWCLATELPFLTAQ